MGTDKQNNKDPEAREKELKELQAFLEKKEAELDEREKALAEKGPSVAPDSNRERPLSDADRKLIDEGCRAYGIDKKYLVKGRIDPHTKQAVLLTAGGAKVRYAKDGDVRKLAAIRVHGIPPEKTRVVMGKKSK